MHLYLISLLVIVFVTLLTWTPLATTSVGILDIIPNILKSARQIVFGDSWQGIGIFAFAFFLYAILQSQAIQSLFADKKKWLQKKGLRTVALITIVSSFLASGLSWYDEFIYFYPLVVPLLLAMGFDAFSALLCLFGGASAGQMSKFSSEAMGQNFNECVNSHEALEGKAVKFTGSDGMGFRVVAWLILTAIVVMFNLWYCNKIFQKSKTETKQLTTRLTEKKATPIFNNARKIILILAGFFLLASMAAQLKPIAKMQGKSQGQGVSPKITSSYKSGVEYTGKDYQVLGEAGKEEKIKLAQVNEGKEEKFWTTFGEWGDLQLYSWFIIGGIIICLLSKQSITNTLVVSLQKSIPLILSYILMLTPILIIKDSGMSENIPKLLPVGVTQNARYWLLFGALLIPFIINLFLPLTRGILVYIAVPILYAVSKNSLMYGTIIIFLGASIAMAFSPANGILQTSLQENKITYKEYLKKTWVLGLFLLLAALLFVGFCAWSLAK